MLEATCISTISRSKCPFAMQGKLVANSFWQSWCVNGWRKNFRDGRVLLLGQENEFDHYTQGESIKQKSFCKNLLTRLPPHEIKRAVTRLTSRKLCSWEKKYRLACVNLLTKTVLKNPNKQKQDKQGNKRITGKQINKPTKQSINQQTNKLTIKLQQPKSDIYWVSHFLFYSHGNYGHSLKWIHNNILWLLYSLWYLRYYSSNVNATKIAYTYKLNKKYNSSVTGPLGFYLQTQSSYCYFVQHKKQYHQSGIK